MLNKAFKGVSYIPMYMKGKNAPEKIVHLHKLLEPILAKTYGILIYQEQLMIILKEIGGFDLMRADNLRRNMGKRNDAVVAAEKKDFVFRQVSRTICNRI